MNMRNILAGAFFAVSAVMVPTIAGVVECSRPATDQKPIRVGIVLTTADPETVFNVFRLATFSAESGDIVGVFLLGKAVELDKISDPRFDAQAQARLFLRKGGRIMACTTCLKLRHSDGSELCPISTLKDCYEMVRASDKVLSF